MDVKIVTYTMQPDLYRESSALLDLPYPKITNRQWTTTYFNDLLKVEAEWIILIDEDAFVFKVSEIQGLLQYMAAQEYACCGMPDGGLVPARGSNPIVCNPFFCIIHRQRLLDSYAEDSDFSSAAWQDSYRALTPSLVLTRGYSYAYDGFEPYYNFFFWLCKHKHRILYLDAEPWPDDPTRLSTILKSHLGTPFLIHTWFSREYKLSVPRWEWIKKIPGYRHWAPYKTIPGAHFDRINRAIVYAKQLSQAQA